MWTSRSLPMKMTWTQCNWRSTAVSKLSTRTCTKWSERDSGMCTFERESEYYDGETVMIITSLYSQIYYQFGGVIKWSIPKCCTSLVLLVFCSSVIMSLNSCIEIIPSELASASFISYSQISWLTSLLDPSTALSSLTEISPLLSSSIILKILLLFLSLMRNYLLVHIATKEEKVIGSPLWRLKMKFVRKSLTFSS